MHSPAPCEVVVWASARNVLRKTTIAYRYAWNWVRCCSHGVTSTRFRCLFTVFVRGFDAIMSNVSVTFFSSLRHTHEHVTFLYGSEATNVYFLASVWARLLMLPSASVRHVVWGPYSYLQVYIRHAGVLYIYNFRRNTSTGCRFRWYRHRVKMC